MANSVGARRSGHVGAPRLDRRTFVFALGTLLTFLTSCARSATPDSPAEEDVDTTARRGDLIDLIDLIERRRSLRDFSGESVSAEQVAVMLRAAQGVTDRDRGLRAAPSAGALYPLETYLASAEGIRRYSPVTDSFDQIDDADVRGELAKAAHRQSFIAEAPVVFVITGTYSRTAAKYGERAPRYVHLEAGHAAQNLLLAAEYLGLGGVPVGAFVDQEVRRIVGATQEETPLYLIPVGGPA